MSTDLEVLYEQRIAKLEHWLRFCLENCDDSPEHNFGIHATRDMRALLAQNVQAQASGDTPRTDAALPFIEW